MKLMISVIKKEEAIIAQDSGADLIDIKNPAEGSLGAQHPLIIKEIVDTLNKETMISATVGDVPCLPCTIAQAAYSLASFGVDYVKVGIKGCKNSEQVREVAVAICRAIKDFKKTKLIIGCYGDYKEMGTVSPDEVLRGVEGTEVAGILIDTLQKDGRSLFDFMSKEELNEFSNKCHEKGFLCSLAGSIKPKHIPVLNALHSDITGVRGAICDGGRMGRIQPYLVKSFMDAIK
ncbi:(5-formylfuran-3-yl)methyl phosphate synthase [Clostridium sporogenes]|uniref:(5-formylfuran-3-yl)methyl phosphate synthase n=1 Tax=Clostridium sporogenes TaxID=1509 RepID=UPI0006B2A348|nr:(5-formylfuran-3-yl)methyl phosphate synthase [Clostridium sporogenes]KOY65419.1 hypothetical protein AN649_13145 [Clostridium sporogenes]MDS1006650.1 (5-formylfuran-3-yl)methyl phosphate synthase [Clostridium sporogenes]